MKYTRATEEFNIYIGYDPREDAAYEVAKYSIEKRVSKPVNVMPIKLANDWIKRLLPRPIEWKDNKMWCPISEAYVATEFAISRFLMPWLQYKGWALFMDCDMLCLTDITEIFKYCDDKYAVMVVKHKQEAGVDTKADGQVQQYYARKNWSSVVLWNLSHTANRHRLKLDMINEWPGRDLHAFKWLKDSEIGELPQEWNFLVGINKGNLWEQKILHYTLGGAWFKDWEKNDKDNLWVKEYEEMAGKKNGVPLRINNFDENVY